jgi:hypothetical protein
MAFPIYARFAHPGNGYDGDQRLCAEHLTAGEDYLIDHMDVGASHTTIYLHDFPGVGFNSVMFDAGTAPPWDGDDDGAEHAGCLVDKPQMCTVDDLIGGEPCLRVARYEWQPAPDAHPVHLCNFHAEPLVADLVAAMPAEATP